MRDKIRMVSFEAQRSKINLFGSKSKETVRTRGNENMSRGVLLTPFHGIKMTSTNVCGS